MGTPSDWDELFRPVIGRRTRGTRERGPSLRAIRARAIQKRGGQLDLTDFARRFMAQGETDVGRRLVWAAVNHHNTDNPHVHIVVGGVDAEGDHLRINGRYIAEGMRWRAQELATRELGPRSELEMERSQSKEVERAGFTAIDRMLAGHASADGWLPAERLATAPRPEPAAG